ncbi:MAG: hypothetical protein EO766_11980 [Hydrotalea sp. AMD]|uniref:hypothetical protein n=1 Tax=Hydrotalea sp. AMD TaxID=2501297 RepID=UPI0010277D52|nr:hypothetical protein [Hydrotalea sp. AMD]RWZ87238.1 MAG: hypothetical protein EO766_11980 [Hydrotalea sp. AMD]
MKNNVDQKIIADWKAYNKRMKSARIPPMSLDEYKNWINGTTPKIKRKTTNKEPTLSKPIWAYTTEHISSVKPGSYIPVKSTMVERARLD